MVVSCSAYNCFEKHVKGASISFHNFPADVELRKKWIIATKRKDFTPGAYAKLCSKHFEDDCFEHDAQYLCPTIRRRISLKKNAIPTIFDFPEHLKSKPQAKRHQIGKKTQLDQKQKCVVKPNKSESTCPTKRPRCLLETSTTIPTSPTTETTTVSTAKQQKSYVGDFSIIDFNSPTKSKAAIPTIFDFHEHLESKPQTKRCQIQKETQLNKKQKCVVEPNESESTCPTKATRCLLETATTIPTSLTTETTSVLSSQIEKNIQLDKKQKCIVEPNEPESTCPTKDTRCLLETTTTIPTSPTTETTSVKTAKQRKYYVGDFTIIDFNSPAKSKAGWRIAINALKSQKKKIKLLQQQRRRLRNKINTCGELVKHLREQDLISEYAGEILENFIRPCT